MSAYGYKQTFGRVVNYVRVTPESGHFSALTFMSALEPKADIHLTVRFSKGMRKRSGSRTPVKE